MLFFGFCPFVLFLSLSLSLPSLPFDNMRITDCVLALVAPIACIAATIPASHGLVRPRSPISGGSDVEEGYSGATVSIQEVTTYGGRTSSVHVCGGALLTPYLVITAARCIDTRKPLSHYRVRVGTVNWGSGGRLFGVLALRAHQLDARTPADAYILYLKRPMNDRTLPGETSVKLPPLGSDPSMGRGNTPAVATGWGYKTEARPGFPGISPAILQETTLVILPRDKCEREVLRKRRSDLICTASPRGSRGTEGVCARDEGGPLIGQFDRLYGILYIPSKHCGQPGSKAVFLRIDSMVSWIQGVLRDADGYYRAREVTQSFGQLRVGQSSRGPRQ